MNLEILREEIDLIDKELVDLLEKRMAFVSKVAVYKKETGKAVLDSDREKKVLEKVSSMVKNKDFDPLIREIFSDIMKQSRNFQNSKLKGLN